MARPRTIDDEQLLRAAREVFISRGAGATTREIAEAGGVSQAVLFQRYGTKERLFFAALLPPPPRLETLLGDPPEPGREAIRLYLTQLACRIAEWLDGSMPGALRAALHPAFPEALSDAHGSGGETVASAIAERLDELAQGGGLDRWRNMRPLADALLALLHGQALIALLGGGGGSASSRADRAIAALCPDWESDG